MTRFSSALSPVLAAFVSGGRVAESLMNVPPGQSDVGFGVTARGPRWSTRFRATPAGARSLTTILSVDKDLPLQVDLIGAVRRAVLLNASIEELQVGVVTITPICQAAGIPVLR